MKCYICKAKDKKINMQKGKIIYTLLTMPNLVPNKYQYFHRQCLQSVICEPQDYSEETVKCALECYDNIINERAHDLRVRQREEANNKYLKLRLAEAQNNLECYDDEETNSM